MIMIMLGTVTDAEKYQTKLPITPAGHDHDHDRPRMDRAIDTRSQILHDTQVLNRTQVPEQIRIAQNTA
jgi:hypothetical protein